jgi:hypothetical protein
VSRKNPLATSLHLAHQPFTRALSVAAITPQVYSFGNTRRLNAGEQTNRRDQGCVSADVEQQ